VESAWRIHHALQRRGRAPPARAGIEENTVRILMQRQILCAVTAIALVAGCSGGTAIAPNTASPQAGARFLMGRPPLAVSPIAQLKFISSAGHRVLGRYACPAKGPIKYLAVATNDIIYAYVGKFAGQQPCGQITSGLIEPQGLYVKTDTHDLYVANTGAFNILVFHRGQTTAYNTYTDPSVQYPVDVTLANDGTLVASNITQPSGNENGSISTWIAGPNGGAFVGNYPMTNDMEGLYVTVQRNGTVFFNDIDAKTGLGDLWSLSCPAGACGAQTQVAGVSFQFPGGMESNDTHDLLAVDQIAFTANTFELPNPKPSTFPLIQGPVGMAINQRDHHWFTADAFNCAAAEFLYPSGQLVGTVPSPACGIPIGIAVDPGHAR